MAPATASSSSSQSSRLSWQPSQEANFQTASLGLRRAMASEFSDGQQSGNAGKVEHRSVFADKDRAELAMAAQADGALHVAFHRKVDALRNHATLHQRLGRKAHHDLGATHE